MIGDDDGTPGIARHLKSALVGAHDHLADAMDERKKRHVATVLEQFEADLAPMLAPLALEIAEHPDTPEHLRDLFHELADPQHFSASLLIGVAVGAVVGPVLGSAVEPYVNNLSQGAWRINPTRVMSPEVAVAATLKNVLGPYPPADQALASGYAGDLFAQMVEAAGQSLGLEEALVLARRQQLTGVTLREVLEYSNVNPKFYDAALNLAEVWPTIGEVLVGWTKGHLGDQQALDLYTWLGGRMEDYEWRRDSVGRPPGPMEVLHLWNRGLIDETQVDDALKASDLAPRFTDWVKELKVYYPPVRSIVPMLRSESIGEARARELLAAQGVPKDIQDAFVKEATHTKSGTVKELGQAQITAAYELGKMDRATALARLEALSYSPADAGILLDLADERVTHRRQDAVVRLVGARYVARRITLAEARTALGEIPIDAATQSELITLWDIELELNHHPLTVAQVVQAYRREAIDATETHDRLLGLGVLPTDLFIVVADGWPPTKAAEGQAAAFAVLFAAPA